ncbi:cytochrome P450 71A4-like isoform X2 [Solanum tuberosum]|uniref:cytochrome P450 71A4-like isoform X2 n=1 Tax=Solanum tuberosum TaxID=4113 RepID=UPI00073A0DBF|nr:PREDICTED: cytochrome P450 71A4-like isoform X2 [Solanum tuberosum]
MEFPWYSVVVPLFVFIFFLHNCLFTTFNNTNKKLPPSPRKLPIIGNLHQLGLHPHRSLHELSKRYGAVMLLHLGSKPVLVASSVDVVRDILKTHDLVWSTRPKSSIADGLLYGSKGVAFSNYSEYWRQIRSVMVLQLLSNKSVQSYRHVREEETSNMIDKIRQQCDSVMDLRDVLSCMTNNIINRVTIGRTYNEGETGIAVKALLQELLALLGTFNIDSVIEERVIRNNKGEYSAGEAKDFVDVLLEIQNGNETGFPLQRDSLKAILLDSFIAGVDSIYTTLEWIMIELLRNPRAMEKLQNEVRGLAQGKAEITEDDLGNMQYLKAVIKETLRLNPPFPLPVPRESMEDVKLLDYDIPAKTQVLINVWAMGRDPLSWDDPEEYRPERFLNSDIDFRGLNFELIPFGAGRRGCPGIPFAIVIIELALARLVHKFNFALPQGIKKEDLDMSECTGISIRRKLPLLAVATPCGI